MNTKQAPVKYRTAWIGVIVGMCVTIVIAGVLRVSWARENARREREFGPATVDAGAAVGPERARHEKEESEEGNEVAAVDDLTDWEDKKFRYEL